MPSHAPSLGWQRVQNGASRSSHSFLVSFTLLKRTFLTCSQTFQPHTNHNPIPSTETPSPCQEAKAQSSGTSSLPGSAWLQPSTPVAPRSAMNRPNASTGADFSRLTSRQPPIASAPPTTRSRTRCVRSKSSPQPSSQRSPPALAERSSLPAAPQLPPPRRPIPHPRR